VCEINGDGLIQESSEEIRLAIFTREDSKKEGAAGFCSELQNG